MASLTRTCRSLPLRTRLVATRPPRPNFLGSRRLNSTTPPRGAETLSATPRHTKIERIILDHIKTTGPISFATYMQLCLSHPTEGYYINPANKVFGRGGDFITSPEISQTFGELIALWLLQEYHKGGKGCPLRIIELGPGKGTLMGDVLRIISKFEPRKHINVHLVETSSAMRDQQKRHLESTPRPELELHWHDSIEEIPPSSSEYTMLLAHEFFDALPVHVLQRHKDTGFWHEVLIDSNEEINKPPADTGSNELSPAQMETPADPSTPKPASSLRRVLASKPSNVGAVLGLSSPRFAKMPNGSFLEVSPSSFKTARRIGGLLAAGDSQKENAPLGGCGLIIDYGKDGAYEDSLRAFKQHEQVDIFREPGLCDMTASVDFAFLKEAMEDLVTPHGPISQGSFLVRMGLPMRLRTLLQAAKTDERIQEIHGAAMRLVDPKGMGGQYQVLGITGEKRDGTDEIPEVWPFVKEPERGRS